MDIARKPEPDFPFFFRQLLSLTDPVALHFANPINMIPWLSFPMPYTKTVHPLMPNSAIDFPPVGRAYRLPYEAVTEGRNCSIRNVSREGVRLDKKNNRIDTPLVLAEVWHDTVYSGSDEQGVRYEICGYRVVPEPEYIQYHNAYLKSEASGAQVFESMCLSDAELPVYPVYPLVPTESPAV